MEGCKSNLRSSIIYPEFYRVGTSIFCSTSVRPKTGNVFVINSTGTNLPVFSFRISFWKTERTIPACFSRNLYTPPVCVICRNCTTRKLPINLARRARRAVYIYSRVFSFKDVFIFLVVNSIAIQIKLYVNSIYVFVVLCRSCKICICSEYCIVFRRYHSRRRPVVVRVVRNQVFINGLIAKSICKLKPKRYRVNITVFYKGRSIVIFVIGLCKLRQLSAI